MMPGKTRIYHYDGDAWALTEGLEYAEQFWENENKRIYSISLDYGLFQYKNSKWSVTSSVPAFFKYLKGNAKGIYITGSMPLYPSPHDDIAIYHYDGECLKRLKTDRVVKNEMSTYYVWLSQESHLFIANYVDYLKYDIWECNFE